MISYKFPSWVLDDREMPKRRRQASAAAAATARFISWNVDGLRALLADVGLRDSFRTRHPDARDAYTWWSYRVRNARQQKLGWRIDYVLTTLDAEAIDEAFVLEDVVGSDHCPVGMRFTTLPICGR